MKSRDTHEHHKLVSPTDASSMVINKVTAPDSSGFSWASPEIFETVDITKRWTKHQEPWFFVPVLHPQSVVSAKELLKILHSSGDEIETVKFQPPELGDRHFGNFLVGWKAGRYWLNYGR